MLDTVKIMEYGRTFATRPRGEQIREAILSRPPAETIELDFQGVEGVSHSFADELVARLAEYGASAAKPFAVEVFGAEPGVERALRRAIANRSVDVIVRPPSLTG